MVVTRLLPSLASGESENWYPVRGLAGRGLGEMASAGRRALAFRLRPRRKPWANRRIYRDLAVVLWLWFLQDLSNIFGSCLGYPFLWYPTVAPEPREECGHSPEVLTRLGSQQLPSRLCFVLGGSGRCARVHPPGVAPEALEEWVYSSRGFFLH